MSTSEIQADAEILLEDKEKILREIKEEPQTTHYVVQLPSPSGNATPKPEKEVPLEERLHKLFQLKLIEMRHREFEGKDILGLFNALKSRKLAKEEDCNNEESEVKLEIKDCPEESAVQIETKAKVMSPWVFKKEGKLVKEVRDLVADLTQVQMELWSVRESTRLYLNSSSSGREDFAPVEEAILKLVAGLILTLTSDPTILGTDQTVKVIDKIVGNSDISAKSKNKCILIKKALEEQFFPYFENCEQLLNNFKSLVCQQYEIDSNEKLEFDQIYDIIRIKTETTEEALCGLISLLVNSFWIPCSIFIMKKAAQGPVSTHVVLEHSQEHGNKAKMAIVLYLEENSVKPFFGVIPLKDRMKNLGFIKGDSNSTSAPTKSDKQLSDVASNQGSQGNLSPRFAVGKQTAIEDLIKEKLKATKEARATQLIIQNNQEFSFRNPNYEIGIFEEDQIVINNEVILGQQQESVNIQNQLPVEEELTSFHFEAKIETPAFPLNPKDLEVSRQPIEGESILMRPISDEISDIIKNAKQDLSSIIEKYRIGNKINFGKIGQHPTTVDQISKDAVPKNEEVSGENSDIKEVAAPVNNPTPNQRNSILIRRRFQKIDLIKKVCRLLDRMDENSEKIDIQIDLAQSKNLVASKSGGSPKQPQARFSIQESNSTRLNPDQYPEFVLRSPTESERTIKPQLMNLTTTSIKVLHSERDPRQNISYQHQASEFPNNFHFSKPTLTPQSRYLPGKMSSSNLGSFQPQVLHNHPAATSRPAYQIHPAHEAQGFQTPHSADHVPPQYQYFIGNRHSNN